MDTILSFKTVVIIFISGMLTSLVIGDFLSLVAVTAFVASEFNLLNIVYTQLPEELRNRYKSKLLIILKYVTTILKQGEEKVKIRRTASEVSIDRKRRSKDE